MYKNYFKNNRGLTRLLIYCLTFILIFSPTINAIAENKSGGLEEQIKKKNAELNYIKNQIKETQNKLEETQSEKRTLTSQLNSINSQIRQIELGIKSSSVTIETLSLEIEALRDDIVTAEESIDEKQITLGEVLRRIQEKDNESILYIMIKNKALSDSIFEIQTLRDLYNDLTIKINELDDAKNRLNDVLGKKENLKNSKVVEISNLSNKKIIAKNASEEKEKFLEVTKNEEKEYQEYIENLKERQAQALQEIFDIESKLISGINYKNLPEELPGLLQTPIDDGDYIITQNYGVTPYSKRFYASGFHNGVDLGAPIGTPLLASQDGLVVAVGNQDSYCWKGAYGKFVVIRHYLGLTTLYAHMSLYNVKEGDTVKKGQVIGYVGSTGLATGPHLHYTVYDTTTFRMGDSNSCGPMPYGGHVNPYNYVIF